MRIPRNLRFTISFSSVFFLLLSSSCAAGWPSCYVVTNATYQEQVLWEEIGSQYEVARTRLRVITAGRNPELQENVAEVSITESLRVTFWNTDEPDARHSITITPAKTAGVYHARLGVVESSRSSNEATVALELRPVDSTKFRARANQLIEQERDLYPNAFDRLLLDITKITSKTKPPVRDFPRLNAESDVIVIGKLVSKSQIALQQPEDFPAHDSVMIISNRVRVLSPLKGAPANEIDVITLHSEYHTLALGNYEFATLRKTLRIPNPVRTERDWSITGCGLIGRPTRSVEIEPEYLLFLRQRPDGRFDPVTGHRYSGMSVKLLND